MADIDYERAAVLMDVIHKVATISPQNTNILGMAQFELKEIESHASEERQKVMEQQKAEEAENAARIEAQREIDRQNQENEQPEPSIAGGRFAPENRNPKVERKV